MATGLPQKPIIEIFSNKETTPKFLGKYKFTVNTAVSSVPVVLTPDVTYPHNVTPIESMNGIKFEKNENFFIVSYGWYCEGNFEIKDSTKGTNQIDSKLYFVDTSGLDLLAENLRVNALNVEISINQWVYAQVANKEFLLNLEIVNSPEISMINVPSAFNGLEVMLYPVIKIMHTTRSYP